MPDVPFLTAVASMGFLALVAATVTWFAYLGYRTDYRQDADSGNRSSLAD